MRIEYSYIVEIDEPPGRQLSAAERDKMALALNRLMNTLIEDAICGPGPRYRAAKLEPAGPVTPRVRPVRSSLGFLDYAVTT